MREPLTTRCCIAGGGPAGIMLGYLLARAGVDVVVLEKWPDFFRDFRGDTIHPSTLQLLRELGLYEKFLALPHDETREIALHVGPDTAVFADFTHLRGVPPFLAFAPQWDFLTFLAREGGRYPGFHLRMATEATDLIREGGRVTGVRAKDGDGEFEIRAELVVGADGRHSTVREKAGLPLEDLGAPIDVLWFRLPRREEGLDVSLGYAQREKVMVLLDRSTYWQCAYLIRKGAFEGVRARGLAAFHADIASIVPQLADAAKEILSWDEVKLLSVSVDHLARWWQPGIICIGDAAHAMSPVGGVGVNLAIQDAVAAANILAPAYAGLGIRDADLLAIQKRRAWPARLIQRIQVIIHTRALAPLLAPGGPVRMPRLLRAVLAIPLARRIPAYLVGVGPRPEHVAADILAS